MTNVFTSFKPAWHLEKIARLREKKDTIPTHVQLIISDLCNQHCLVAGTMIECPEGSRPIENLRVGDYVTGSDGKPVKIEIVGSREVDEIYEVSCDGKRIYATGEHPILTQDGWKEISSINPSRDSAVVRVRMQRTSKKKSNKWKTPFRNSMESFSSRTSMAPSRILQETEDSQRRALCRRPTRRRVSSLLCLWLSTKNKMESSAQKVGSLHPWPQSHFNTQFLRRLEGSYTTSDTWANPTNLFVWLWSASNYTQSWSWKLLGGLRTWASASWTPKYSFEGWSETYVGSYEETQPDVQPRNSKKGPSNTTFGGVPNKNRTSVFRTAQGESSSNKFLWDGGPMGQTQKSRFQSCGTEKSYRSLYLWYLQWLGGRRENSRRLWARSSTSLYRKWLGMLSCILPSRLSSPTTRQYAPRLERLLRSGIKLERNLELRQITSVSLLKQKVRVYNFSCPPIEAYISNGIVTHNCHFCAYRMEGGFSTEHFPDEHGHKNPRRFMPTEKAFEIIDDCADLGVKAIEFTGGGEPTVHPEHVGIISYAQHHGLQTGLVTNGVRLKDHPTFDNLTWLRVSLDAGCKETYEEIRCSKQWDKVISNIKLATSFTSPYLGVGFVITRENYREILVACKLVKSLGVPYIRLSAMFSHQGAGYYKGVYEEIESLRKEAKKLEDETFKVIDFFGDRVEDLELASPDYDFCGYQQFVLYIGGDQRVYSCCTNAYTTHGEIGDLREQSFADWIHSYRRYDFNAKSCHHCQFNNRNELINYLLNPEPPHVDFV